MFPKDTKSCNVYIFELLRLWTPSKDLISKSGLESTLLQYNERTTLRWKPNEVLWPDSVRKEGIVSNTISFGAHPQPPGRSKK